MFDTTYAVKHEPRRARAYVQKVVTILYLSSLINNSSSQALITYPNA